MPRAKSKKVSKRPRKKEPRSYLQADNQPEFFVNLADLQVKVGPNVFPCHYQILSKYSKVLGAMFVETDKAGWADGVAAIFSGHEVSTCELVLAMMHGSMDVSQTRQGLDLINPLEWSEMEDVLKLAHKLDAPKLLKTCEEYALEQDFVRNAEFSDVLKIIALSSSLQLADLRQQGYKRALRRILASKNPTKMLRIKEGEEDSWNLILFSDYHRLFRAVARALKHCKKDLKELYYDRETGYFTPKSDSYLEKLLQEEEEEEEEDNEDDGEITDDDDDDYEEDV